MTSLVLTLIADLVLAGLLVATIVFCGRLNTRVRVLQDSKSELAQLIRQFDESTEKATASIVEIQHASKQISQNIQAKLDKANFLADDLSFMIERGSRLADQIEANVSASRKPAERKPFEAAETSAVRTPPQTVLPPRLATVNPSPTSAKGPAKDKSAGATGSTAAKTNASLESVLERMAGRTSAGGILSKKSATPSVRLRSKAEQELFDALKSSR